MTQQEIKKGCKGFRKHTYIDDTDDEPDSNIDLMAAFYLGYHWIPRKVCKYCKLIKLI